MFIDKFRELYWKYSEIELRLHKIHEEAVKRNIFSVLIQWKKKMV